MMFDVSEFLSITTLNDCIEPPPPINPKTKIKIKGKIKLNIIADGLLVMALRLPLVIAHIALN